MDRIKVLIVDDHAVLRHGVRALLARKPDITVVGEAESGEQALEEVKRVQPDVILMDITMPGMGGLEATKRIKALRPETRILVLTQHEDVQFVVPLLQAGAAGYILKKAGGPELVAAIRTVYQEGGFMQPSVAHALANQLSHGEDKDELHLTKREQEVLTLIAEGLTSREIGDTLCLSEKTVVAYRTSLMEKLNVHNTAELVRYAIREGLVKA